MTMTKLFPLKHLKGTPTPCTHVEKHLHTKFGSCETLAPSQLKAATPRKSPGTYYSTMFQTVEKVVEQ